MSGQNYSASVSEGFNFHKDSQQTIGHITELTVGTEKFVADLEVQDPTDIGGETKAKVVGVISGISWDGGFSEPMHLSSQVGYKNANTAGVHVNSSLSNTNVLIKFNIYRYDPQAKKYYLAFHTKDVDLKGLILKEGDNLAYSIASDQSTEVPSPLNYELYLSAMPQEEEQDVHLAVSVSDKLVKKWGVTGPGKV